MVILLLSFGLRVYRLDYQSLRGDEGLTYVYGIRPLDRLFEIMRVTSPHPPAYYTLTHFWMALAGETEFALRFPSVVAGVLLVVSIATLGKMLFNAQMGLLAALLVALNSYQIFYAQDARSYPLVTLIGMLATIILWRALRRDYWQDWIGYGLLLLAAMYTHYYAVFIAIAQGLFVLYRGWQRRQFPARYAIAGIIDVLLYVPWLVSSWGLVASYGGAGETAGFLDSIWRPLMAFAGSQQMAMWISWIVTPTVIAPLLCLGALGLWRQRRISAILLISYLAVPIIGVYIASQFRPIFNERYLILASPAFYLLTSSGIIWLTRSGRLWATVITLLFATALLLSGGLALSNYYFNPQFAKSPPWREVLQYISQKAEADDALIYTAPLPPILYYNQDRLPSYLIPYESDTPLPKAIEQLQDVLNRHPRVWLVPAAPADWQVALQMEPWLDRHSVRLDQTFFRILHIGLYESPASFYQTMRPQAATFSDGIQLQGFRLGDGGASFTIEAGEAIPLTLLWHAEHSPATAYTVFTHLVGPDGTLWGQWDNPPVWGTYPTDQWSPGENVFDQYEIPVKEDAPPGEYHLLAGMYDPRSGERLTVLEEGQIPGDDHVQLNQAIIIHQK